MTGWIVASSVLILVVAVMRYALRGKISLRLQYALWALVLARLLVPFNLAESSLSVLNAVEAAGSVRSASAAATPASTLSSAYGDMDTENEVTVVTAEATPDAVANVYHAVFDWGVLAKCVWLAGIGTVGLILLFSNLSFVCKLKRARKKFEVNAYGLSVYEVEALPSPCLFGLFRPAVYITPEVTGDEMKLRHVLAHELTHYRHGDHIWSALRCVCLALHWYNPLVWLAAALSRRDAELSCDEGTIRRLGEASRAEYGRTLIGLTCQKRAAMDLFSMATTMTGGKKGIKERITLIAQKPKVLVPALIAVIFVAAVAVSCTFTGAKAEDAEIIPLTAEELEQYNEAFVPMRFDEQGNAEANPLSNFLTSYYDKPEDINLAEFLRYFSPSEEVTDDAEFEALKASDHWSYGDVTLDDMPVPIHRYSADTINEALEQYADITLDDLSGVGADELIYLKEYDAYYNFTSDAGAASFACTSGEKQGDTIRLYSTNAMLTLKLCDDGFWVVSHQLVTAAEDAQLNGDVTLYDCEGLSVAIPNEYVEQLVIVTDQTPEAESAGIMISVYEKQSYEDSRADLGENGGWLFSIARYTQAQYEQFLMSDGSGQSFFAKDDTYYYGWFFATDVQFYRSGVESADIDSDDWNAWEALNEACGSIRDDFTARNGLTAYDDSEFRDKEFTYDGTHLSLTYYPYYAYQDTAKAEGFDWEDVAYTLVLSQPATQGDTGIWCVERWYDNDGNAYVYFPDSDGVPACEYYADLQTQCDTGGKVSLLDPKQTALEFVQQYFGHTKASLESIQMY